MIIAYWNRSEEFTTSLCLVQSIAPLFLTSLNFVQNLTAVVSTLRDIFISWVVTLANLSCIFCRNKIARKVLLTANDGHQFVELRREMHANGPC